MPGLREEQRDRQALVNARVWGGGDFLAEYAHRQLRPAEAVILLRHRDALDGRLLELGSGAGRLTSYLVEMASEVHGVDLSPAMVAHSRATLPTATFREGDMTDLTAYEDGSFAAVLAACNVIDVLDDDGRRKLLRDVRELLVPRGLLVMSSHNRAHAAKARRPPRVRTQDPLRMAADLLRMAADPGRRRREAGNRRRLRPLEREEPGYAIVNDAVYEFSLVHYYISRDAQAQQFAEEGFELVDCLDLDGRSVPPGGDASASIELHYVARRTD